MRILLEEFEKNQNPSPAACEKLYERIKYWKIYDLHDNILGLSSLTANPRTFVIGLITSGSWTLRFCGRCLRLHPTKTQTRGQKLVWKLKRNHCFPRNSQWILKLDWSEFCKEKAQREQNQLIIPKPNGFPWKWWEIIIYWICIWVCRFLGWEALWFSGTWMGGFLENEKELISSKLFLKVFFFI